jgi:CRISPR-associated protein (TIGR03986 family)
MLDRTNDTLGFPSPYNFVPLSPHVRTEWGPEPSHDIPYRDGLSGTIDVTITADSSLLVSDGNEDKERRFFRTPDGKVAIPGSSLRGMIRNVVEIASFSRFRLVDDRRFGLRDLTQAARLDYGRKFTKSVGPRTFKALSKAGWLSFDGKEGCWQITPCHYARIDHRQFRHLSPRFDEALARIKDSRRQEDRQADKLYEAWERAGGTMAPLPFEVERRETPHPHSPGHLVYREAFAPRHAPRGADVEDRIGTVVFTGLPSRRKHLEFVFLDGATEPPIRVPPEVWRGFLDVHEWQEKPSPTWLFWSKRYNNRTVKSIPIFYLEKEGELDALGLALMFKLAQDATTHTTIKQTSLKHLERSGFDLAERLFGRVEEQGENSLKGRLSFGMAALVGEAPAASERGYPTTMGAPKASYFPAYVRQVDFADGSGARLARAPGADGRERLAQYRTYMRWNDKASELRGWKRYPVRGAGDHRPPRPTDLQQETERTEVTLHPLYRPEGLVFTAKVRFHNLRPFELGALCWALDWGGNAALRHSLGMGKPFGWGQLTIRIKGVSFAASQQASDSVLAKARQSFVDDMDQWVREKRIAADWASSLQVRRLKAMANPANASRNARLAYMTLDPTKGAAGNDFLEAKRRGLILRDYWDADDQRAFEEWRDDRSKPPPAPLPQSAVKGLEETGRLGYVASPRRPAPNASAEGSASALFRRGDRVTNVEEQEPAEVIADQRHRGERVRIRYADGTVDTVPARLLARR